MGNFECACVLTNYQCPLSPPPPPSPYSLSHLGLLDLQQEQTTDLDLLLFENVANAIVERGAGEHGGDWVGQVQDCFKH